MRFPARRHPEAARDRHADEVARHGPDPRATTLINGGSAGNGVVVSTRSPRPRPSRTGTGRPDDTPWRTPDTQDQPADDDKDLPLRPVPPQ